MSQNLPNMLENTIAKIREMVDVNSVVGTPITTPDGVTIIPVSKVSMGVASGGVDYESKKTAGNNNFGGDGGSGVSVVPVAFLVVHADGSVEMMNVSNPTSKPADIGYNVSSLVERAPEIIEKIKAMIPKKKAKQDAEQPAEESAKETTKAEDSADEDQSEHVYFDASM